MTSKDPVNVEPFDVVIVGAGPVGCVAALQLCKRGLKVAIVEKNDWETVHPPHLSGVGAPLRAFFQRFELMDLIDDATVNRGTHFELCTPAHRRFTGEWTHHTGRLLFHRRPVDLALRERVKASGVSLFPRSGQLRLHHEAGRVCGLHLSQASQPIHLRCDLLLGCDGSHSSVARLAKLPAETSRFQNLYQGRRFKGSEIKADHFGFYPSAIPGVSTLVFSEGNTGEVFIEVETQLHRGHSAPGRTKHEAHFQSVLNATPALAPLLTTLVPVDQWTAITRHGVSRRRITRPGLLLLGDAAHTADPISSAGLLTGLLGLDALLRAVDHTPAGPWELEAIAQDSRDAILPIQRFSTLFRALLDRPALLNPGISLINQLHGTRARLLQSFNGEIDHAKLFSLAGLINLILNRPPNDNRQR